MSYPSFVVVVIVMILSLVFKGADEVHFMFCFKFIELASLGLRDLLEAGKVKLKKNAFCQSLVTPGWKVQRHQKLNS